MTEAGQSSEKIYHCLTKAFFVQKMTSKIAYKKILNKQQSKSISHDETINAFCNDSLCVF